MRPYEDKTSLSPALTGHSTQRERGHDCILRQCHRGCESEQERFAQRRHAQLRLGLWVHVSPAGLRGHRHPAGSALLHRVSKVGSVTGSAEPFNAVLNSERGVQTPAQ